uniref:Exportin-7/Ran-binding protein 17 TPR repeats domain-containing protein n=1 Tax=Ditylenchus dipsaci TaxID=166011 RepID=A0A915CW17_9BILA
MNNVSILKSLCLSIFTKSRIRLCELVVCEGVEDPLDDLGTLKQMMELLTIQDLLVARKRLIWIITMMAVGVNGKRASNSCDVHDDIFDGEVVSRVWKLMKLTDANLQAGREDSENVQLEFAYLSISCQEFGVADDSAALKLYAIKVITNLQYWGKDKKLLSTTLALLDDLTVAFTNVRRLLKTDEIIQLLENHSTRSVILFREVSKIICDYGGRLLALPEVSKDQHYKEKVKNIDLICGILRHVLSGIRLFF